jgi:hypothetical protein
MRPLRRLWADVDTDVKIFTIAFIAYLLYEISAEILWRLTT